jgi:glutathione S-transferase
MALRVHRIPYSTNVERVALACGHKGLAVEWVDHHAADRASLVALSGQELVPVLESGDEVVVDSPVILEWLESRHPEPPLYPRAPARAAEVRLLIDWFNRVWKRPPNQIADGAPEDLARALRARMAAWLEVFEDLLDGREYLAGDGLSALDCVVFPFLKYPVLGLPEGDEEVFHRVLVDGMPVDHRHARLRAWVHRVDAHPRA